MTNRRELYRSPEGEAWFLGRDPSSGLAVVIHETGRPSGESAVVIDLRTFFADAPGPEQQALLRLIATLVHVPPYA